MPRPIQGDASTNKTVVTTSAAEIAVPYHGSTLAVRKVAAHGMRLHCSTMFPMPSNNILDLLKGGDRRSIGHSDQVATMVGGNLQLFPELIAGLWSKDALIRMRAADASEKVTRRNPELLTPYRKKLLGLLGEAKEQELRWHLAVMVPRLVLNSNERQHAVSLLNSYLQDRSSIVKTFALQGLADLAHDDRSIRSTVIETLREARRSGTPAMKARSRKLLHELERV